MKIVAEKVRALLIDYLELVAILRGLEVVMAKGWLNVMVETDSLKVSCWTVGDGEVDFWKLQLVL